MSNSGLDRIRFSPGGRSKSRVDLSGALEVVAIGVRGPIGRLHQMTGSNSTVASAVRWPVGGSLSRATEFSAVPAWNPDPEIGLSVVCCCYVC